MITWFSEDVTREFGQDIVLERMAIFDMSVELLGKAQNLPDDDFKRQVISNLNQSLSVIGSHPALKGDVIKL
jgi:hypothetical protein